MSKSQQRILQLYTLLSKLLDSLCFELAVTVPDENSESLFEILLWRKNNEISQIQMAELYSGWLQARNVFDIFKAKQTKCFPKSQLIGLQVVQQNFMNTAQITRSLQILNALYNDSYLTKRQNEKGIIESIQQLFAFLDTQGVIHLRLSSLFFFCGAVLICEGHTIPMNYDTFRVHFSEYRKDMCEIQGMVSLRWFKNFLLCYPQRNLILKNIMQVFGEMEKYFLRPIKKSELPNITDEAFEKWKLFPRFSSNSNESRSRIDIYRRVFQENQHVFFDQAIDQIVQHFTDKYGDQFIKCFEIDSILLRQFTTILKECLNRYLDILRKVGNSMIKINSSQNLVFQNKNVQMKSANRQKDLSQLQIKNSTRKLQTKERTTPTKGRLRQEQVRNRTPTHRNPKTYVSYRQFGSAQRSVSRNRTRQYTPTKATTQWNRQQNNQQSGNKYQHANRYIDQGGSLHFQTMFFRNKRVESYETVMKRLRKK